ncbi:hypothetical protein BJ165DRAFT_1527719 [Panaeolus papilionaceus]|nr:hypothetical protein BJ165DRAFT_1527719 [Panaeolus papilionaceus]
MIPHSIINLASGHSYPLQSVGFSQFEHHTAAQHDLINHIKGKVPDIGCWFAGHLVQTISAQVRRRLAEINKRWKAQAANVAVSQSDFIEEWKQLRSSNVWFQSKIGLQPDCLVPTCNIVDEWDDYGSIEFISYINELVVNVFKCISTNPRTNNVDLDARRRLYDATRRNINPLPRAIFREHRSAISNGKLFTSTIPGSQSEISQFVKASRFFKACMPDTHPVETLLAQRPPATDTTSTLVRSILTALDVSVPMGNPDIASAALAASDMPPAPSNDTPYIQLWVMILQSAARYDMGPVWSQHVCAALQTFICHNPPLPAARGINDLITTYLQVMTFFGLGSVSEEPVVTTQVPQIHRDSEVLHLATSLGAVCPYEAAIFDNFGILHSISEIHLDLDF